MNPEMHNATHSTNTHHMVDNTDWLKTFAIILVAIDHTGYFFIEDAQWWSVFGRMAAPVFFFLMGYARSRTIPLRWIWLGVILTLLDSWNTDWEWVAPNILFSLAFIRVSRPFVKSWLERYGWAAFAVFVAILLASLPIAAEMVDYGAEGWLWALFGLCQRMYVDERAISNVGHTDSIPVTSMQMVTQNWDRMRLLACFIASLIYVWQEQLEFLFSDIQLVAVILGVGVLSRALYMFVRGPSRLQPRESIARSLRWLGRHTLEIYAIQLAGSELIIRIWPDLAP